MSEAVQSGEREHLSQLFSEVPHDGVLVEHTKPVVERAGNELDWGDLWRIERRARELGAVATETIAVLGARLYDQDLTIDEAQKSAYASVRERLLGVPGEIAVVLVESRKDRQETEAAYCYVGIVPEEIQFENDPYKDTVPVPGARGFELFIMSDRVHLSGNGPSEALPISLPTSRPDGFSLIPNRFSNDSESAKFADANTPYLLVSREIPDTILEQFSLEMAGELMLQLATVLAATDPAKVTETFGSVPEVAEHLAAVRQLVSDHKAFYDSVLERNAAFLTDRVSIEQLEPNYNALRNDYKREFRALQAKYGERRSIAHSQIVYERTRTWPYIDFADSRPDAFHSPGFAIAELANEDTELRSRIERADAVLGILDLLA